ncbi:hypothetical protein [Falsiroseomonas sp.]|uniref:hypothetical protein n=1 Tax=Falsiroseomonas sp. TaxID=2870721 RepID=UPI00356848B8
MIGDTVTVVHARGRRLAKTIDPAGVIEPYDNARMVDLHQRHVAGLQDVHMLLHRLLHRPDCCVVRGEILDPARARGVRRLVRRDLESGDEPTLRDVPRRWLALDLDSVPLPAGADPRDLAGCARAVMPLLPGAFGWASCVVQATASHGIKAGARLRLWFWLDRPMTGAEAIRWLRDAPVDRTVFWAAQPIYVAAPIFLAGRRDHLPHRLAVLPGDDAVHAPPAAYLAQPRRPPTPPIRHDADADRRLGALLRMVRRAPEGRRHPILFWAACRAGELARDGHLEELSAAAALADAAMEAGGDDRRRAEQTARDGIARGREEAAHA